MDNRGKQGKFNLKPHKLTDEDRAKGRLKGQEVKRQKRKVAEILNEWVTKPLTDSERNAVIEYGIDENTKSALLVLPLLENVKKGDTKSIALVLEYLQEDRKKEKEIEKLKEEIALLKLQQETEKQKISYSDLLKDKVVINMDVVPIKKDD